MKKICILAAVVLSLVAGIYIYAEETKGRIADSVLRLHVVANSNSAFDQALKLKVRDGVISVFGEISKSAEGKEEALITARQNVKKIEAAAKKVILEEGLDCSVHVYIGKTKFPTKYYGKLALPRGEYDAVNVIIGSGKGENWWCVMYPPLCFIDPVTAATTEKAIIELADRLGNDGMKIIYDAEEPKVKIRFKILELF